MRHLRSILYALVLAPAVWILTGVGFTRNLTGRARDAGLPETTTAALLLLLAGAAYGILLLAPLSPAGPALAGLVFLGVGVWALVEPDSYAGVWPPGLTKDGFDLSRPGYALTMLLAVPLLCTALSARRWSRYEPIELPLIGTVGRARGAAPVAGTPVAAERTTVISAADRTEALPPRQAVRQAFPSAGHEPPTEALPTQPMPTQPMPTQAAPVQAAPPQAGPTQAGPTQAGPAPMLPTQAMPLGADGDEPTTMLRIPAEEPTTALATVPDTASDEPTARLPEPADEPTVPQATATPDEPTTALPTAPDPTSDEPTAPQATATDEPTAPTDVITTGASAAQAESPEHIDGAPADDEPTMDVDTASEPTTTLLSPADAGDDEQTQVLRLPVAGSSDEPTDRLDPDGTTQLIGPGDRAAQERARQAFRDRAAQQRARQAFAERAAQQARDHGEQTQVIDLDAARSRNADGDTTQVHRATVEPPDEHTEVLRLPAPGGQPTAEVAPPRPGSVLDLERPADEREERTAPAIPAPRDPQHDEAEEPTQRL